MIKLRKTVERVEKMKKIVSIILIILSIICINLNALAVEEDSSIKVGFSMTNMSKSEMKVKMSLSEFKNVPENSVMTATMTLEYDTSLIESVEVVGKDNWKATIESTTKRVILETDKSKANTDIAEFIFTTNKNATIEELNKSKIVIKDINISDGENLDQFERNKEFKFTLKEENNNLNNNNQNTNTNTNTNQNTTNTNNISTNTKKNTITGNKHNTLAPTKLPAAGIKNLIILSIVIIAIATIIFKIKSRKIKY